MPLAPLPHPLRQRRPPRLDRQVFEEAAQVSGELLGRCLAVCRRLTDWLARARVSGIRMLEQFADTLAAYQEGILNYYAYRISTGPLEGTNNKIKTMPPQAYGFRDHAFLKLKILGLHETRYALVG